MLVLDFVKFTLKKNKIMTLFSNYLHCKISKPTKNLFLLSRICCLTNFFFPNILYFIKKSKWVLKTEWNILLTLYKVKLIYKSKTVNLIEI